MLVLTSLLSYALNPFRVMKHAFAPILRGRSGSWWSYVAVSLHFLWGPTACREQAQQILIWEVLFAATEYVGLQIRHVKIVMIMVFNKIYCMSPFCHDYLIWLASFSARLLWRWIRMLYNIMEEAIYEGGSKSFRPDQLFKVTEIKQLCYFSIYSPFISTHTDTLPSPQMALYIPRGIFHLARLLFVRPETFGPTLVSV